MFKPEVTFCEISVLSDGLLFQKATCTKLRKNFTFSICPKLPKKITESAFVMLALNVFWVLILQFNF